MKKLYAIGEKHFYPLPEEVLFAINKSSELPDTFSNAAEYQQRIKNKRERKLREFIKKYKPKVFFCEGRRNDEIEKMDFEGEIIYLDKGCEWYENFMREYEKLRNDYGSRLTSILKKIEVEVGENGILPLQYINELKKADREYEKNFESLYKIFNNQNGRETYWTDVISNNYTEPSAIKVGNAHLFSGINAIKLVLNISKIFNPTIYFSFHFSYNKKNVDLEIPLPFLDNFMIFYKKIRGKESKLDCLLKQKGIKSIVKLYLSDGII